MKNKKEIQPNDIWNKESQDKIKEHILKLAQKQTPEDRLETELAVEKYTAEDIAEIQCAFAIWIFDNILVRHPDGISYAMKAKSGMKSKVRGKTYKMLEIYEFYNTRNKLK